MKQSIFWNNLCMSVPDVVIVDPQVFFQLPCTFCKRYFHKQNSDTEKTLKQGILNELRRCGRN